MKLFVIILNTVVFAVMLSSCKKDFLDKKPDQSLLVPVTLTDFQAILDNNGVMNRTPALGLMAGDEYTISTANLPAITSQLERSIYLWAKDPYQGATIDDWNKPYQQIFYANVILDGLIANKDIKQGSVFNEIKGSALFFRAYSFYQLVQLFCAPYTAENAESKPGIPLRLKSDITLKVDRGMLKQTYDQIITDLNSCTELLAPMVTIKARPSKQAAYALLARVYLMMGDYNKAILAANACLEISHILLDYNLLDKPSTNNLFPSALPGNDLTGNTEIIFYSSFSVYNFTRMTSTLITTSKNLYDSYNEDDLRKSMFFNVRNASLINFKGSYGGFGNTNLFSGLALDEVYLIRAESLARLGKVDLALNDLNYLLKHRINKLHFTNFIATDKDVVLERILLERRKELITRGTRWTDLKRLNTEDKYKVILTRNIGAETLTLNPNDNRYVFPIPNDEIRGSGISQNP